MSVLNQLYQQVIDGQGNVTFQPVSNGAVALPGAAAQAAAASGSALGNALSSAVAFVGERAQEGSSHVALGVGAVLSPIISDSLQAAVAVGTGNVLGAVQAGLPAMLGIFSVLAGFFTPQSKQVSSVNSGVLSNDQIQSVVASLTQSQLISLLDSSASAHVGPGVTGSPAVSHPGAAVTTSAAATTVQPASS
jgi:hypothetical protein